MGSSKSNLMEAIVEAAGVEAALVEGQSLPSRIPSEPTMENRTLDTIFYKIAKKFNSLGGLQGAHAEVSGTEKLVWI